MPYREAIVWQKARLAAREVYRLAPRLPRENTLPTVENSMKHLPNIDSISELAEFWQAQDLTGFEDELEEVTIPVFQQADQFQVRLSTRDARSLRSKARQAQLSEGELLSQWVHERLGEV